MAAVTEDAGTPPYRRQLIFLAMLLGAEYLIAALLFDSERMPSAVGVAAFRYLGEAMPLLIATGAATIVVGAKHLSRALPQVARTHKRSRSAPYLVLHGLLYLTTLGITVFVFNHGRGSGAPNAWVALWVVSGIAGMLTLALSAFTWMGLWKLIRASAPALAMGAGGGLVLFGAGLASRRLWQGLARVTFDVSAWILRLTTRETVTKPDELILGTPEYLVRIDHQCSGYEGIGLVTLLLGFYLVRYRRELRFPAALVLLPIGASAVWIANAVRISALIWMGAAVSPAIAEGGFHSGAGWLFFTVISLGLIAWGNRSELFVKGPLPRDPVLASPTAAYLLPLMALLFIGLVTSLFTQDFDLFYPLKIFAAAWVLWRYFPYYRPLDAAFRWAPIGLGVLVYVLWIGLDFAEPSTHTKAIPTALAQMPAPWAYAWIVLRVVGSCLVVPAVEEIAFRGFLLRRLVRADFEHVSFRALGFMPWVVSSLAFGALHQRWLVGTLAGLVYAYTQSRRGTLTDAVLAHATTNTLLAVHVLVFEQWHHW